MDKLVLLGIFAILMASMAFTGGESNSGGDICKEKWSHCYLREHKEEWLNTSRK